MNLDKKCVKFIIPKKWNARRHPAVLLSKIEKTTCHCVCFPYYIFFTFKARHRFHNSSFLYYLSYRKRVAMKKDNESQCLQ